MSLTKKGKKIITVMKEHYGSDKKAEQVFNDMIKEKKLTGVERKKRKKK